MLDYDDERNRMFHLYWFLGFPSKRGCGLWNPRKFCVLNDPENSLEPESDKLVDNYYFRCLPWKKLITQPFRVAMTSQSATKNVTIVVSSTVNWYWFTNIFVAIFLGVKMNENWLWNRVGKERRRTKHFEDWRDYYLPTKSRYTQWAKITRKISFWILSGQRFFAKLS